MSRILQRKAERREALESMTHIGQEIEAESFPTHDTWWEEAGQPGLYYVTLMGWEARNKEVDYWKSKYLELLEK